MKTPEDLLKIYRANCAKAFFTACANDCAQRQYSMEEAAHITYFKLQEEYKKAEQLQLPLLYTRIIGPVTHIEKKNIIESLQKNLPEISSIIEHRHLLSTYIIVESCPWISSVIDTFPQDILLLSTSQIHRLALEERPSYFPCELFLSVHATYTVCIINIEETEEALLKHLHMHEVEKVVAHKSRAYIKAAQIEGAQCIYHALSGKLINKKPVFTYYYPDSLSNINLFL
ncbi:hypothetical protein NEAUS06_1694 [Nematocida ausubeli]|nr:hypothetical protein NEAUS06_1694 [Nematocida ausubeli]